MLPYVDMRQYPRPIRDLVLNRRQRSRKQGTRFCRQFRHILGPQDIYGVSKSAKAAVLLKARVPVAPGFPSDRRARLSVAGLSAQHFVKS